MGKFIITEEERNRILGMHKTSTSNHYLMEQATGDTQSNTLSWEDFKLSVEKGYPVFETSNYDPNMIYASPPGVILKEKQCNYFSLQIKKDGTFNINPYSDNCFDEGWSEKVMSFWSKKGNTLNEYVYETLGVDPTTNRTGKIKHKGLTTNIKFDSKFNDYKIEFYSYMK
jgi:hypothetical protein